MAQPGGGPPVPLEFTVEAFVDPSSVIDVVRGILHTIFFHRHFPSITPTTHDVLDLTLPFIADPELETTIDARVAALERQLDAERSQSHRHPSSTTAGGGARSHLTVDFLEKNTRRRKAWYTSMRGVAAGEGDDQVCWERWTVKVTVAEPRTESEKAKVRAAMRSTLLTAVMKIVTTANLHKDHIPPITNSEQNPFPSRITVNQKGGQGQQGMQGQQQQQGQGWGKRMGLGFY